MGARFESRVAPGLLLLLLQLLVLGCGGTESNAPTPAPAKAFAGTIFVVRNSNGVEPLEAPVGIDGANREFWVPLDLSPYWPGDDAEFFQQAILKNFSASQDGRFLYVAAKGKIARFDLPEGGQLRELFDPFNSANIRVSPNGLMLAFQQPQEAQRVIIMNASGTNPRAVFSPPPQAGLTYGPPVWVGNDRLMVAARLVTGVGPPTTWVTEMRSPDWEPQEYLPLRGAFVWGRTLLGTPDGDRLYVERVTMDADHRDTTELVEYLIDQTDGVVKIRFPPQHGGAFVLSPDGSQVVTLGSLQGLAVFDIATGLQLGGGFGKPGRMEVPVTWTAAEYP
ncbi:MAG: hypothetical protein U0974_08400 [Gemmatimonadales bacterium]|nr:hypothetical protein [Gemmatimonadales bacterium]MDZ4389736.1 hypothetical protein [Gemmatimonadales bacterium]